MSYLVTSENAAKQKDERGTPKPNAHDPRDDAELAVQRDECVQEHHQKGAPEVGIVAHHRAVKLEAKRRPGEDDTPQLVEYVLDVNVQLFSTESQGTISKPSQVVDRRRLCHATGSARRTTCTQRVRPSHSMCTSYSNGVLASSSSPASTSSIQPKPFDEMYSAAFPCAF